MSIGHIYFTRNNDGNFTEQETFRIKRIQKVSIGDGGQGHKRKKHKSSSPVYTCGKTSHLKNKFIALFTYGRVMKKSTTWNTVLRFPSLPQFLSL
jgi:hypothetical protein